MNGRKAGQTQPFAVGKHGEAAVLQWLQRRGAVQDVRNDRAHMMRDIDFIVSETGRTIEVKTDTYVHQTGNMVFELSRDNGPGCFYRSKADSWAYVAAETGDAILFDLSKAQVWLVMNLDKVTVKPARAHRGGKFRTFIVALVPIEAFCNGVEHERITLCTT